VAKANERWLETSAHMTAIVDLARE